MKTLIKFLITVIILVGIAVLVANYFLNEYAQPIFTKVEQKLESKGIKIEGFEYGKIRMAGLRSLRINDFKVDVSLDEKLFMGKAFHAEFEASHVTVRIYSIREQTITFSIDDFDLYIETDKKREGSYGQFKNAYFKEKTPIKLTNPVESGREVADKIKAFFADQQTEEQFEFKADITLTMDEKEATVRLFSVEEDGITRLEFDGDDIYAAAVKFDVDIVEAEAEIIAKYPLKVPKMMKITRDAKRISKDAHAKDKTVPEDAFRHLYWSYNLTRELGPEFAQQVTDAHETAPGNTKAERAMDYHNNEFARGLADRDLSVTDILRIARTSPKVIRTPK